MLTSPSLVISLLLPLGPLAPILLPVPLGRPRPFFCGWPSPSPTSVSPVLSSYLRVWRMPVVVRSISPLWPWIFSPGFICPRRRSTSLIMSSHPSSTVSGSAPRNRARPLRSLMLRSRSLSRSFCVVFQSPPVALRWNAGTSTFLARLCSGATSPSSILSCLLRMASIFCLLTPSRPAFCKAFMPCSPYFFLPRYACRALSSMSDLRAEPAAFFMGSVLLPSRSRSKKSGLAPSLSCR